MKQIFFFIFALTSIAKTYAQTSHIPCPISATNVAYCTFVFDYDNAGNRISRGVQACMCPSDGKAAGNNDAQRRTNENGSNADNNSRLENSTATEIASIIPNPTSGSVTVQFTNALEKATLLVSDSNGKLLGEQAVSGTSWDIDLSQYAAGMYFLSLRNDGSIVTQKVIKTD